MNNDGSHTSLYTENTQHKIIRRHLASCFLAFRKGRKRLKIVAHNHKSSHHVSDESSREPEMHIDPG